MNIHVGDKLIHPTYGPGEISRIEVKPIDGVLTDCYVFQTSELSLWIPIDKLQQHLLHSRDGQDDRNQGLQPS